MVQEERRLSGPVVCGNSADIVAIAGVACGLDLQRPGHGVAGFVDLSVCAVGAPRRKRDRILRAGRERTRAGDVGDGDRAISRLILDEVSHLIDVEDLGWLVRVADSDLTSV